MPKIHATALVGKDVELGEGCEIGPYCVLDGAVRLGKNVRLVAAVHMSGPVVVGDDCIFYPNSCIGFPGQDIKFKPGMPTAGVLIGNQGIFREGVTIHAATKPDAPTRVGDNAFMMAHAHIGHDGRIGNNVVMVNNTAIGGHAELFDNVTMGGGALLHQFDRVGRMAFLAGAGHFTTDVPPFCIAHQRNLLAGLNLVGLRRAGVPREQITRLREAYRNSFRAGMQQSAMIEVLRQAGRDCPLANEMADFIASAKRPLARHLVQASSREAAELDAG